jgi:uncharacterized membrane protein YfcA
MISLALAATLVGSVLVTSFISGIFGMAGGMILMGILLAILPLSAAMVLHGLTQMASNGWRAWLWRTHIEWPLFCTYAAGALLAVLLFSAVQFAPNKALALIVLGLTSLAGLWLPGHLAPNIARPAHGVACGAICTILQLISGVSGPIFDVFFVQSKLDRKQIVATKAAIQVLGHALKAVYFGLQLMGAVTMVPPLAVALAMIVALIGTQLSRTVLDAISDVQFRSWSRKLIATIAVFYLAHGILLLLDPRST